MNFVSDFHARRTRDDETGWELFKTTVGPGYEHFELRHPTRHTISFWGEWEKIENIVGRTALGHMRYRQVFRVHAVDARSGSQINDEKRSLIEASLTAYGGCHDGPLGPVEVVYED